MPEFLHLIPPAEALHRLLENVTFKPTSEQILVDQALGRVTAAPVCAPHPLPTFPRSAVDGYAVRAADTFGASESLPAYLHAIGEVPMGGVPSFSLFAADCGLIHTGGMLPVGADAVVMVEFTSELRSGLIRAGQEGPAIQEGPVDIEIFRSVAVGENVIKVGEDVLAGEEVIQTGVRIRPVEIGGLMALGIPSLSVAIRPRVAILSTGDEVVPPAAQLSPGQVRDINTYTLSALIEQAGGMPVCYGIIADQPDALLSAATRALTECDIVVITAGSSASARDLTAQVINQLGKPGVLVHGVNIRPGKPTILGVCGNPLTGLPGRVVIGLPGNPVSAYVIASLFVIPVIEGLLGLQHTRLKPSVLATLAVNIPSQAGREDWVPVYLVDSSPRISSSARMSYCADYRAEPLFGKSNLIFTLVRADGLVRIPSDATGLSAGETVEVFLF